MYKLKFKDWFQEKITKKKRKKRKKSRKSYFSAIIIRYDIGKWIENIINIVYDLPIRSNFCDCTDKSMLLLPPSFVYILRVFVCMYALY